MQESLYSLLFLRECLGILLGKRTSGRWSVVWRLMFLPHLWLTCIVTFLGFLEELTNLPCWSLLPGIEKFRKTSYKLHIYRMKGKSTQLHNTFFFWQFPKNDAKNDEIFNYFLISLARKWRVEHLIINPGFVWNLWDVMHNLWKKNVVWLWCCSTFNITILRSKIL